MLFIAIEFDINCALGYGSTLPFTNLSSLDDSRAGAGIFSSVFVDTGVISAEILLTVCTFLCRIGYPVDPVPPQLDSNLKFEIEDAELQLPEHSLLFSQLSTLAALM